MTDDARVVALVSGGLDSLILTHSLLQSFREVAPVYVRCGLVWESAELLWLRRWLHRLAHPQLRDLAVVDMPVRSLYGAHWSLTGRNIPSANSADASVYLPGRNALLLTHAAAYGANRDIGQLAIGLLAGNPFGDATPKFFRHLASSLSLALGRSVRILTPLRHKTKASLIRAHQALPLALSFSCLNPQRGLHCGRCNKCAERRRGFEAACMDDPTRYASRS